MSRNIIIDNSTLSSVSRLMGVQPVRKSYSVEGDYSAFEGFCNSLLFYDDFFFIDDYVEKHREVRRETFPYIRNCLGEESDLYDQFTEASIEATEDLVLEIRAGEVTSEHIKRLLDAIGLTVTSNWIMRSSVFYLTLQLVVNPEETHDAYKYTPLTETIFRQLSHKNEQLGSPWPLLVGSDAEEIERCGENGESVIESQIIEFTASLQWLMRRSLFYLLTAKNFGASIGLHPIRHQFANAFGIERGLIDGSKVWADNLDKFFSDTAAEALRETLRSVEREEQLLDIPIVSTWALTKTGSVSEAVGLLLDYRSTSHGEKVRAKFRELDAMVAGGSKVTEINKIRSAIQMEAADAPKQFGVTDFQMSTNVSLSASLMPGVGIPIPFKKVLSKAKPSPIQSLFRSVVRDIASFQNLGSARGKLLRQINRVDSLAEDFSSSKIRHENIRYRRYKSDWKYPM